MSTKNNLKRVLEDKGISQLQLYKLTGITPSNLSGIVTGRIIPYPGWRKRIAKAIGAPEEEIFPPLCGKEE